MLVNSPVADMLTRIRNANVMRYKNVEIPFSKMKVEIARILKEEGFIEDYIVNEVKPESIIVITLKYGKKRERVITGLKCISKPGLRVYAKTDEIPKVLNGLGIAILSTPQGIVTDKKARQLNVGGEVLAYIW